VFHEFHDMPANINSAEYISVTNASKKKPCIILLIGLLHEKRTTKVQGSYVLINSNLAADYQISATCAQSDLA